MIITGSTKKQYHCMRRDPNSFVQDSAEKTCSEKVFPKTPTRTCKQFAACSLAELRHSQIEMTAGHGFMEPSKAHTVGCLHPFADLSARILLKFTQAICVAARVTMPVRGRPPHQWLSSNAVSLFSTTFCHRSLHYEPLTRKQKSMQGHFSWKAELNTLGTSL